MSQQYVKQRPSYYVQTGGMQENPYGVPLDEIVRFCLDNPPEVVAQVVFGKYVESSGLIFSSQIVQPLFDRTQPQVMGNYWHDKAALAYADTLREFYANHGSPFHTGIDFARQTDFTVITTVDTTETPARVVYYKRLNRVPWETIYGEVGKAVYLWGPNVLADSTGMGGDVVMDALDSRAYCPTHHKCVMVGSRCADDNGNMLGCDHGDYIPLACVEPYDFNGGRKWQLIEHLRNVLSFGYDALRPNKPFGLLRSPPIPQVEEEMTFYMLPDKGLETDCLFSLCLAAWAALEDPYQGVASGSIYGT